MLADKLPRVVAKLSAKPSATSAPLRCTRAVTVTGPVPRSKALAVGATKLTMSRATATLPLAFAPNALADTVAVVPAAVRLAPATPLALVVPVAALSVPVPLLLKLTRALGMASPAASVSRTLNGVATSAAINAGAVTARLVPTIGTLSAGAVTAPLLPLTVTVRLAGLPSVVKVTRAWPVVSVVAVLALRRAVGADRATTMPGMAAPVVSRACTVRVAPSAVVSALEGSWLRLLLN